MAHILATASAGSCQRICRIVPKPWRRKRSNPWANAASAAQPVSLPLRELNKRSGQFGSWAVVVQQAKVDEYEYQWEGKTRTGNNFSCIFVSSQDPSEYCIGQMRWNKKDENKSRSVEQKLTDGLAFSMSHVSFMKDAKKQYIHSPIQTVVSVGDTHFSPLLNSKDIVKCSVAIRVGLTITARAVRGFP